MVQKETSHKLDNTQWNRKKQIPRDFGGTLPLGLLIFKMFKQNKKCIVGTRAIYIFIPSCDTELKVHKAV